MLKKIAIFAILLFTFAGTALAQLSINLPDKQNTFELNPGAEMEIEVLLRNSYRGPVTIAVYAVDGGTTSTGTFAAKQLDDEQFFIGQWAKISQNQVFLEANQTQPVTLKVSIPNNATPGDYSGAIVVSRISATDAEAIAEEGSATAAGIKFNTRLARAFYVSIPGEKTSSASIGEMYHTHLAGNQYKIFTPLENAGNTTLRFTMKTQMQAMLGESQTLPSKEFRLLPSQKSTGEIIVGELPILESYQINQKITYYEQNLLTGEETYLGETERSLKLNIIPWNYILPALAVLALLLITLIYKVVSKKLLLKSCKKYTVKSGDTLMTIAQKSGVKWKTLAKINKINPPYELKTGSNILVPGKK